MNDHKLIKQVGRAIRSLRQQRRISQKVLAQRVGVPRSYLTAVENGKKNLTLLSITRLAKALDVPVAAFFLREAEDTERPD